MGLHRDHVSRYLPRVVDSHSVVVDVGPEADEQESKIPGHLGNVARPPEFGLDAPDPQLASFGPGTATDSPRSTASSKFRVSTGTSGRWPRMARANWFLRHSSVRDGM